MYLLIIRSKAFVFKRLIHERNYNNNFSVVLHNFLYSYVTCGINSFINGGI